MMAKASPWSSETAVSEMPRSWRIGISSRLRICRSSREMIEATISTASDATAVRDDGRPVMVRPGSELVPDLDAPGPRLGPRDTVGNGGDERAAQGHLVGQVLAVHRERQARIVRRPLQARIERGV